MRLRPFGEKLLVLSFAALEDYYQVQARLEALTRWSRPDYGR
ncbi:hypothetical protein ACNKHT_19955 [Shigella flexneri]